jgi:hypothetical protein
MTTNVFISWSGDLSRRLGECLRQWFPAVLQFVKPYFTPDDIEKGARWGSDITKQLDDSQVGVICLTRDNLEKPWILFEAGALSKSFDKAKVCTVLFDVDTTDLKGPLTIFQHTRFDKPDFKKLIKSINASGSEAKLEDTVLDSVFDMWWPQLEDRVRRTIADHRTDGSAANRSERDILEEILELSRLASRRKVLPREFPPEVVRELLEGIHEFALIAVSGDREMLPMAFHRIERPIHHLSRHAGEPFDDRLRMLRHELEMLTMRPMERSDIDKRLHVPESR